MKQLPFPLAFDHQDMRLYLDDSADTDVLPTVAWMDVDNADPETNVEHGRAIVEAVNAAPSLAAFVEQMARMITPEDEFADMQRDDPDIIASNEWEDADDLVSDFSDDRLMGEYHTFMDMVREARKLLAQ